MQVFHPFYLVWNPGNTRNPRVQHPNRSLAVMEARRLAKENPGEEFVVLESRAIMKGSVVVSEDWARD